jgi:hypothetical protein
MRLTMGYNKGGPVRVWSLCMDCNVHSMAGPSDQWEGCTQNEHTYSINNIYIHTHTQHDYFEHMFMDKGHCAESVPRLQQI